jgi:tetratricopeptide (TPR) repeat protein
MSTAIQDHLDALMDRPNDMQLLAMLSEAVKALDGGLSGDQLDMIDSYLEELKASKDWQAVIALIDVELSHLPADHADETTHLRKARLLAAKAEVLHDELFDGAAALEAYKQSLELNPDNDEVEERIEDIETQQEKWPELCAKFINEGEQATDQQLATYLFQCAAEVVWRNEPRSERVEDLLRRSLDVEPRNGRSAELLERLLRSEGRFDELATLLERRSSVAATQEERMIALLGLGELWAGQVKGPNDETSTVDESKACDFYRNALALDPKNGRALRMLVQLLTQLERWSDLAHVFEDALRARSAAEQDVGMLVQIGQLYAQKLDDLDRAEEFFRRVQKIEPGQRVMLDFYRRYYLDRGEAVKMLVLLDKAQRSEKDVERRLAIAHEWARVAEHDVGNLDKAIDIWKGIMRLSPGHAEAMAALKRLYRETSKWNALRELLKEEIESLGDDQVSLKIELLMQIVELYNTHLKLPMMVINTYSAILELQPDHHGALDALVERYEAMGRWKELIGMLDRRKQHQTATSDRIETLHRIATLWLEKFGNHSQAIQPLEEILELDPLEERALTKLKETHQRRRNWRGLLALIKREAAHRDVDARRALVKEMARVATEKLGDNGEGIEVWNQLLSDNPHDGEALSALADLYRREDRWPALAEVLHRQHELAADDESAAISLLEQLGDIYTNKLRGPDNAIEVWRQVLAIRPDHPKAVALLRELFVQQRRWQDLEQLFAERDQWAQLAETLTAAADRSSDRETKVLLYTRVGEICSDQLDNAERGVKAYERVLAVDETNIEVASRLVPLYRATERWSRLRGVYETLLEASEALEDKLALLVKIRELCEEQLGSKQLAFDWAAKAFRLAPDNEELGGQLRRLAAAAEAWAELIAVLEERVEQLQQTEPQQTLLREIAEICATRMHRPEDAEPFFRKLLELQKDDHDALDQLEQLYSSRQRWEDLVAIYRRQGALADEGSERHVDRLFKIAYVQEERLADPASAVDTYRELVSVSPHDLRALKALERLYHVRGQWEALVDILKRQLALVDDDDTKVELLYGLGELLSEELDQRDAAIEELARALAIDLNHRPTALALEEHLQSEGDHQPRVATLLEPVYDRSDDHAKLATVLEVLVSVSQGDERQQLLRRLQSLYDKRLQQLDKACGAALQLFELDPHDEDARLDLARFCEQTSEHELFVTALQRALEQLEGEKSLELALRWDLARTLDRQLARPEDAEAHVRRIVDVQPSHSEAFTLLERILRDKGKWLELREVLHRRRELADDVDEQRRILTQICALNEDVLGDDAAAISAYEEMLQLQPDDEEAVRALERHYRDAELWQELADFYAARLSHVKHDDEINQLKVRQAEVRARELEDIPTALDLLEEVAASNPEHSAAMSLLELLLTEDAERRRVTEVLENVYQRLERWQDLVTVLLVRRDLCEDTFEQVELLTRVAVLLEERIEDAQSAFFRYRDALALAPATVELQESVKRLIEQLELWEAGAQAWQAALAAADEDDVPLLARLLAELAALQDERLDQADEAAVSYRRLLELDPESPETGLPATTALARLHEIANRWPELVDVLQRQLAWTADAEGRRSLLLRIGVVQEEELGQAAKAIETYASLLEEDPGSIDALDALERLYLEGEHWNELVAVFKRRVDLSEQTEQRVELWRRIAELYETEIQDQDQTVDSHLQLLSEDPRGPRVFAGSFTPLSRTKCVAGAFGNARTADRALRAGR